MYWLYFCILCNKKGIKGLWGHKGPPSLGLGPALVLQWILPWPYNTPNMALYWTLSFSNLLYKSSENFRVPWSHFLLLHRMQKYSQYRKGHGRVHWRTKAGPRPNEGWPLCLQSPLIPFLLHRMQKYSQYIKGHVWCISGPWQGPLKDQGGP